MATLPIREPSGGNTVTKHAATTIGIILDQVVSVSRALSVLRTA